MGQLKTMAPCKISGYTGTPVQYTRFFSNLPARYAQWIIDRAAPGFLCDDYLIAAEDCLNGSTHLSRIMVNTSTAGLCR